MASPVQKAFCVLEFNKCHSVITVHRRFRQRYNQEPLNANNIRKWHRMFEETGCLCKGKTSERPVFQRKTLKELASRMNEAHGNRRTKAVGSYKCHKKRYGVFSERG
ncbi:hypothetical protein AVEN_262965-1 [Araneus ventricosus]|uniref:DUF4817 domain-containing protein n=1 Tax=Araneus ventricosus TaxID=182803 RepID=A0A4Y2DI45_ARAVE|nr:hypothetical protein AVEN_262965-1 [Araneus ventricosus]